MIFRFGKKSEVNPADTQAISVPEYPSTVHEPDLSARMDLFRIDNLNQAMIVAEAEHKHEDMRLVGRTILNNMVEICERQGWQVSDALADSAGASDFLHGR